ncbi:hypothetical protein [Rhodococcus opacus]|uniref:hypothetical protein n=1 Tax=Rhodococcus opacus TaxID=37919 RepID=UPI00211EF439|nr:hypothetical protein [Rhodococcus opacus]
MERLAEELAHHAVRFGGAHAELRGEALPGGGTEPGHPDEGFRWASSSRRSAEVVQPSSVSERAAEATASGLVV